MRVEKKKKEEKKHTHTHTHTHTQKQQRPDIKFKVSGGNRKNNKV